MWELACLRRRRIRQHLCLPCRRFRSLAKARQLPQGIGFAGCVRCTQLKNVGAGLPAKAVDQATSVPAVPPLSQPRQSSTAPTGNRVCRLCQVYTVKKCGSWLACEGGGSGNISACRAAAFAASPKLDSSTQKLGFAGWNRHTPFKMAGDAGSPERPDSGRLRHPARGEAAHYKNAGACTDSHTPALRS